MNKELKIKGLFAIGDYPFDTPDNDICEGCEYPVDAEDAETVVYFDELWHVSCAREDARINACIDAEDRYYHEFDE